ncbi:hypothetical protein [Pseudomonas phage vB_PaeP_PAO1_1-15pyo]|nr:terminase small subunit [Pseudomonas phage vB_PaeP_PAO1_1-15pyo]CEF89921.1 hypothetical protein [Pseudomonas phage vB_PaeP_PAO1_1-15pyo]
MRHGHQPPLPSPIQRAHVMSKKQTASAERLGLLHELVCTAIERNFKWYMDNDIPIPASDIAAATKFLKDNEITCDPSDTINIDRLREEMRQAQAENRRIALEGFIAGETDDEMERLYTH